MIAYEKKLDFLNAIIQKTKSGELQWSSVKDNEFAFYTFWNEWAQITLTKDRSVDECYCMVKNLKTNTIETIAADEEVNSDVLYDAIESNLVRLFNIVYNTIPNTEKLFDAFISDSFDS